MDPKIKKRWIKALLSGKYKQGREVLKTGDGKYCCLGVLCELYAATRNGTRKRKIGFNKDNSFMGKYDLPPDEVVDWAGLECKDPILGKFAASSHNDGMKQLYGGTTCTRKRFPAIAKLIDRYL